mgnify:CR=1 FL=1|jgi:hypothetical protein
MLLLNFLRNKTKAIMIVVVVFFVLSCFAGYGLYTGTGSTSKGEKDYPVANVDKMKIMRSELEHVAYNLIQRDEQEHHQLVNQGKIDTAFEVTSKDIVAYRREALSILIAQREGEFIRKEIKHEAKLRKVEVRDEDIDKEFLKLTETFPTREEFDLRIESMGVTEKQVKDDIRQNLLREKLLDDIKSEVSVTEEDARAFYKRYAEWRYEGKDFEEVSADVFKDVRKDKEESKEKLFEKKILNKVDVKVLDEALFDIEE